MVTPKPCACRKMPVIISRGRVFVATCPGCGAEAEAASREGAVAAWNDEQAKWRAVV